MQYGRAVLPRNLLLTVTIIIAMLSRASCVQAVAAAPSSFQTKSLFRNILSPGYCFQRFYRNKAISIPLKLKKIGILTQRYLGRGAGIYPTALQPRPNSATVATFRLLAIHIDNASLPLWNNSQKVAR